jgi:hypothetical protein
MRLSSRRITPRLARAAALLSVLCALGACAVAIGGCGATATLDPVAKAAEVSSQQQGFRFSMSMQFSSSALPGEFSVTAHGYIDERKKAGELNIDLSKVPGASSLPGGGLGTVQMIFQFPVFYMHMPFLDGRLPAGKSWMKLDLSKLSGVAGIDASQLSSSFNEADAGQFLDFLRGSSGDVKAVGEESIDGAPTTHYTAILQLDRVLERLPSDERAAVKSTLEKLGEQSAIPVDVWIDRKSRVRRIQMSLGLNVPGGAASSTVPSGTSVNGTITMDFTNYGPVPPIVPPPASAVFDASGLESSLSSG